MISRLSRGAGLLAAFGLFSSAPSGAAEVQFRADGDEPIVSYTRYHGMIPEAGSAPLVRIYGDGRVRVHRPAHLRASGDYEMRLGREALQGLLTTLEQEGLTRWNAHAVRAQRDALDVAAATGPDGRITAHVTSDPTLTVIELRFAEFAGEPLHRDVRWSDAGTDARRFPSLTPVVGLTRVTARLREILWHPALRVVDGGGGEGQ